MYIHIGRFRLAWLHLGEAERTDHPPCGGYGHRNGNGTAAVDLPGSRNQAGASGAFRFKIPVWVGGASSATKKPLGRF